MSKNNDRTINEIIRLMQADKSVDAPANQIRWSKNIFRARAAEPRKSVIKRVLAVLQMDLPPNRAAFGERSAAGSQTARQMLFAAGENALDVRIVKTERGFDLSGQILGENFAGCAVKLGEFESAANAASEFKFTQIPSGNYELIARNGEREIVVEILELR